MAEFGPVCYNHIGPIFRKEGSTIEKRKDNRGRNLRENERQRSDGCYEYRYIDPSGKKISVYSWRLVSTDRTPPGKKDKPALRDQVKEILKALLEGTMPIGGRMTVVQLCGLFYHRAYHFWMGYHTRMCRNIPSGTF